jgi:hypothetical protein
MTAIPRPATYELWVARREKWFRVAMTTQQFPGDRTEVV